MAAARPRRTDLPETGAGRAGGRPPVRAVRGAARTPTTGGLGIRWDRVGRMALLVVLVGITGLYVGPLHSYWSTRHEAQAKRAEVARLQRENVRLRERRTALRSKGTLEKEARRLGMVRQGERPFVVRGLPKGP